MMTNNHNMHCRSQLLRCNIHFHICVLNVCIYISIVTFYCSFSFYLLHLYHSAPCMSYLIFSNVNKFSYKVEMLCILRKAYGRLHLLYYSCINAVDIRWMNIYYISLIKFSTYLLNVCNIIE